MEEKNSERIIIGVVYMAFGVVGFCANGATLLTFSVCQEFHSAVYYWMNGIALADTIMCFVLGIYAGFRIISGITCGYVTEAIISCLDHSG